MTGVILVVVSPGLDLEAYRPMLTALRDEGVEPEVVAFPCAGSVDDLTGRVSQAITEAGGPVTVLADGLGATLALSAGGADRYVLLGPVLDVVPVASTTWLAAQPVGASVDLSAPVPWQGHDLREVLLGAPLPPLGCLAPALATEVQAWVRAGEVGLPLPGSGAPTWIGIGLLDDLAPPEAVVPASRRFADRELVRLGLTRLDPEDYDHAGLLRESVPVRAAVRAALEGW